MSYSNFRLAVYFTVNDVINFSQNPDMSSGWEFFEKHLSTGKVYIETFRAGVFALEKDIKNIKKFFMDRGIQVSGGITTSANAGTKRWNLFCFTCREDLEKLEEVIRFTAGLFDEIILDDFFFTDCRCSSCIEAKGDLSWEDFRTKRLAEVSESLVMKPAKEVNPSVKVIIKFPNWYEHYQFTGYNLKDEPSIFDAIYTGTESRDPAATQQNLPRYLSYFIYRYIENTGKGKNRGGWFDSFDCYDPLHYSAQGLLTLLAKSPEITLFCYNMLKDSYNIPVLSDMFEKIDPLLPHLGKPRGISCYKPFNSRGEDYLHNYLGMCGIPFEPCSEYPSDSKDIMLTQSAAADKNIFDRIMTSLSEGARVIFTSGFWNAAPPDKKKYLSSLWLSDRKIDVDRYAYSPKICSYQNYSVNNIPVRFHYAEWATNDMWPVLTGGTGKNNGAILLKQQYSQGELVFWNMPDHNSDLYLIPPEAWNVIRKELCRNFAWVDSCPGICLFLYDNGKAAVYSELEHPQAVNLYLPGSNGGISGLLSKRAVRGSEREGVYCYSIVLNPGEWDIFSYSND